MLFYIEDMKLLSGEALQHLTVLNELIETLKKTSRVAMLVNKQVSSFSLPLSV